MITSLQCLQLQLQQQQFKARFQIIQQYADVFERQYVKCIDTLTNKRIVYKHYLAEAEDQKEAIFQNLENYVKLSSLQGICKFIAFSRQQQKSQILAAFQYNQYSLGQYIKTAYVIHPQNTNERIGFYIKFIKQAITIVKEMSQIGIDLDQLNYGNILIYFFNNQNIKPSPQTKQLENLKFKIFYDQRQKIYDKVTEGIKTFTSIQKLSATIQNDENYFMQLAQMQDPISVQLIYQIGLLLIDMMYQAEQASQKVYQSSSENIIARDQPLRRAIPSILLNSQKSYYIFQDEQIRLNSQYLDAKTLFLQNKNLQTLKQLTILARAMIASQQQRVSIHELLGQIDRIVKIHSDSTNANRKIAVKSVHSLNTHSQDKKGAESQIARIENNNSNLNLNNNSINQKQTIKYESALEHDSFSNKKSVNSISRNIDKHTISRQYLGNLGQQNFGDFEIANNRNQKEYESYSQSHSQSNSQYHSYSNLSSSYQNNIATNHNNINSNLKQINSNLQQIGFSNYVNEGKKGILTTTLESTKQTIKTTIQTNSYKNNHTDYSKRIQHAPISQSNYPIQKNNSQQYDKKTNPLIYKNNTQPISSYAQPPSKQIIPKQHILANISKCHESTQSSLENLMRQIQFFPNLKKKQYYDNSTYFGELSSQTNKRLGLGVYIYPSGDVYFGTWRENQLINGTYIFKNGQSYQGSVKNGKQGWGKYRYSNGNVYQGEWKDDIKDGKGTMYYLNQDKYQGEWKKGKKNGWGKYWYNNGTLYEGNFVNGRKNGFGTISFPNGTRIQANWQQTHVQGQGKVYYPNGDYYQGQYHMSQKHGKGLYIWSPQGSQSPSAKYEGQFKKDTLEGEARIHFTERQYYNGRIRNGKRDGQGTYVYQNGDSFKGQWKNDFKLIGNYKFKNGDQFQGKFKQNQLNFGVLKYANGQSYEGEFRNGYRHGVGSYRDRNGQFVCEGHWENDDFISK